MRHVHASKFTFIHPFFTLWGRLEALRDSRAYKGTSRQDTVTSVCPLLHLAEASQYSKFSPTYAMALTPRYFQHKHIPTLQGKSTNANGLSDACHCLKCCDVLFRHPDHADQPRNSCGFWMLHGSYGHDSAGDWPCPRVGKSTEPALLFGTVACHAASGIAWSYFEARYMVSRYAVT